MGLKHALKHGTQAWTKTRTQTWDSNMGLRHGTQTWDSNMGLKHGTQTLD